MKRAIIEYLNRKDHVSFAELERDIPNFKGDWGLFLPAPTENVLIWRVSREAADALKVIIKEGIAHYEPCSKMIYLIDGCLLMLPDARGSRLQYKKPHWAPCVLVRGRATTSSEGHKQRKPSRRKSPSSGGVNISYVERIAQNNQQHDELQKAIDACADTIERIRLRPKQEEVWRQGLAIRREVAEAFAQLNGWRKSSGFSVSALRKQRKGPGWTTREICDESVNCDYLDHPEYFRADGRPISIIAHNYTHHRHASRIPDPEVMECCRRWAELNGLVAHFPSGRNASWYNPGWTQLVCYTLPGINVLWLPEQNEPAKEDAIERRAESS